MEELRAESIKAQQEIAEKARLAEERRIAFEQKLEANAQTYVEYAKQKVREANAKGYGSITAMIDTTYVSWYG